MVYCLLTLGLFPLIIWLFIGICSFILILFIYFVLNKKEIFLKIVPFKKYTLSTVEKVTNGFIFILKNKTLLLKLLCILFIHNIIRIYSFVFVFKMIGIAEPFFKSMLYTSVLWFSEQFVFTPGNIGIKESIMGALTVYMDNVFNNGILFTVVLRIIDFSSYFFLFLIFCYHVLSTYFNIKQKKSHLS
jgi:uncharacterized membrane protein YbhN (UPF0104 family)